MKMRLLRNPSRFSCAFFGFCRKFLAICGKNADNKFRYAGGCKGRVFLASEKFNPVRECGPGFRKNLVPEHVTGKRVHEA